MAASYLRAHGYDIDAVNWRQKSYEIDIVARKGKCLVFVEVKSSQDDSFGPPELRVNLTKRRRIATAASEYLSLLDDPPEEARFDVISIFWPPGKSPEITHLESAFMIEDD